MSELTKTPDMVRASVSSIYSDLLRKRSIEREQKEELKRIQKEEKKQRREEKSAEKKENMTKEERRQAEVDAWKEIVVGLTGDDLDYSSPKKGKKKYRKWIDDKDNSTKMKSDAVKKPKKRNYQKEFAPELNMLKALVAEQNRFSADLLKRYQNAAGPNTKDAAPPNKTIVELMSTINASRANSLGMLREIGNLKKTIADLYMKQKKLDADIHGSGGVSDADIALMGSDIASSIFGDSQPLNQSFQTAAAPPMPPVQTGGSIQSERPQYEFTGSSFNPDEWDGGPEFDGNTNSVLYESIPHQVVVEWHKNDGKARFKAVRTDTGEELVGAPLPIGDPSKLRIDEEKMRVKGQFDEIYPLEIK